MSTLSVSSDPTFPEYVSRRKPLKDQYHSSPRNCCYNQRAKRVQVAKLEQKNPWLQYTEMDHDVLSPPDESPVH